MQKFQFDRVIVNPSLNSITRNGVEKRIEPKVMALLCLFANNPMQVISRQDITEALWPDVVVGEETITRAIFALRGLLGDDARQPAYIETISKKGYRFLQPITIISENTVDEVEEPLKPRNRYFKIILWGVFCVAVMLIYWLKFARLPDVIIATISPVTQLAGSEGSMTLAPNQQQMVYLYNTVGASNVYLHDFKKGTDVPLTADSDRKASPVWLDDHTLAYIRCIDHGCQIVRQAVTQEAEVIYESPTLILQMDINPKNSELIFAELKNGEIIELKSLDVKNGKQTNFADVYPELPRKILAAHGRRGSDSLYLLAAEAGKPIIYMLNTDTKQLKKLIDSFDKIINFSVGLDNHLLVAGDKDSVQGLWIERVDSAASQLLLRASGEEKIIRGIFSADGKSIYYENLLTNLDVNILKLNKITDDLPVVNTNGIEYKAVISSDKKSLYFVSNRTNFFELWRYDFELKKLVQVTHLNAVSMMSPRVSHDGKNLLLEYGTNKIYLAIVSTESGNVLVQKEMDSHKFPLSWSHNDRFVYASEHNLHVNLFRYDVSNLNFTLIKNNAGLFAEENQAGTALAYVDYDRNGLIERNLTTGQETQMLASIPSVEKLMPGELQLSLDWGSVFATEVIGEHKMLYQQLLNNKNSSREALLELPKDSVSYSLSDTGGELLLTQFKSTAGNIMQITLK